jgi:hypothetical protein
MENRGWKRKEGFPLTTPRYEGHLGKKSIMKKTVDMFIPIFSILIISPFNSVIYCI